MIDRNRKFSNVVQVCAIKINGHVLDAGNVINKGIAGIL